MDTTIMHMTLRSTAVEKQNAALLFGLFEDAELSPSLQALDKSLKGYVKKLIKQGLIKATLGSVFPIIHPDLEKSPILLVGCGNKAKWNAKKCRDATIASLDRKSVV